ncbi:O-methyltransferase [Olivibacter domesticus]|uniref:Predicted O-methyltransferase YrrM n=1 Tax=Olivibacter domesticus TaxID=407022 RepID=A0A1H7M2P7_OLID1|nr:O-methyltransferase [Olivibacter domesticus]SEL05540.1 Predicted O-methyltransferase YrrM [Olivibacter domesticus]
MDNELFTLVDNYISKLVAVEDDVLQGVNTSIEQADMPQISVSASQGKFLQLLAKLTQARKILELGTLAGYSTIWLARALPNNGKLITIEYSEKHAQVALTNIKKANLQEIVDIRVGRALDILPQIEKKNEGPFDLIFIDADKPPYLEYFDWAIKLARPGTLIIADNVIREGKVLDAKNADERVKGVQRLNESLSKDTRVFSTIIQTVGTKEHDGMILAIVN